MSYLEKCLIKPPALVAEPWDSSMRMAPDPSWPAEKQLAWFSKFSLILALNVSESCRMASARQADKQVS
jgi:hypothetical protein